jgi:hypothetical protein
MRTRNAACERQNVKLHLILSRRLLKHSTFLIRADATTFRLLPFVGTLDF